jgi:large repetitive protein
MRLRFFQVLVLAMAAAAAFAGVARALDFDDEDPNPPHPEIGLVYHYEIGTHAGCLPHHLVLDSGQLPPGLTLTQLNDHTGLVSGIATQEGTFSAWLDVKDCENRSAQALFTFEVWARRFSIATPSLPPAALGSPYSVTLATSGIPSNTTWAVTSGSLPAGLALSKDGLVSGTPTAVGPSTFTVQATGVAKDFTGTRIDSKQYTLNVAALAARLSRATAEAGVPFRTTLIGTGGQAPYTWSATGTPAGLTVATDGTVSGVPTKAGAYTLTTHVVDTSGASKDVSVRLVVRPRLAIASKVLPSAASGHAYNAKVAVRGGVAGLRWSIASGSLPTGLKLGASTGRITGVPTRAGTFRITLRVRDALGAVSSKTLFLRVR